MNKKVCIYCNVGHFIEVFEIQLEIAQQHLDRGDSVEFLFCDGFIPICEINIKKELETCLYCIGRRNSGISLLKGKVSKKAHEPGHMQDLKLKNIKKKAKENQKAIVQNLANLKKIS